MSDKDGGEDENHEESINVLDKNELTVDQEQRKQDTERVSFGWCQTVRDAGQKYRERDDIGDVASALSLDTEEARDAVIVYRLLFESPPEDVSFGAYSSGYSYYGLNESIEEIAGDDADSDELERTRDQIREFVGAVYRVHNPDEESEVGELPDEMSSNLFDVEVDFQNAFKGISALTSTIENLPQIGEMVHVQQDAFNQAAKAMSLQEDISNIAIAMDSLPSIATQYKIPDTAFTEIQSISTAIGDIPDPYSAGQQKPETSEPEDESALLEEVDEEKLEDLSDEEAVGYSLSVVVDSLTKPDVGEWYLDQSEGMQKTVVRFMLFIAILVLSMGNVPLAVGGMTITEPVVSDIIRGRLEEKSS